MPEYEYHERDNYWTRTDETREGRESLHVVGPNDNTPAVSRLDIDHCSMCYLGHPHSLAYHERAVKVAGHVHYQADKGRHHRYQPQGGPPMTTLHTRILDYLTAREDMEANDLAFELQQQIDNPLANVCTGGEVRELCIARGNPNLYQTVISAMLRGKITHRKASKQSILIDRESLNTWLADYEARKEAGK